MPNDISAKERARLIMQSTVVTAADIIEQIHQAETTAKIELAEHLDKTIAVAADAVNRMNIAEVLNKEMVGVLGKIRQACSFTDDDAGQIGVTTDPHIDASLFSEICTVLKKARGETS